MPNCVAILLPRTAHLLVPPTGNLIVESTDIDAGFSRFDVVATTPLNLIVQARV